MSLSAFFSVIQGLELDCAESHLDSLAWGFSYFRSQVFKSSCLKILHLRVLFWHRSRVMKSCIWMFTQRHLSYVHSVPSVTSCSCLDFSWVFSSIHIVAGADGPLGSENEKQQSQVRESDRTAVSSLCPFGTGHAPRRTPATPCHTDPA